MSRRPPAPDGPDTAWVVVGRGTDLAAGPARAFPPDAEVRGSVTLDRGLADRALGALLRSVEVEESGLRAFAVGWYDGGDGLVVAVNPAGGNRVAWPQDAPTRLSLAPVDEGHLTSVHVRFLLRHLTTGLLAADLGGRPLHAVTAVLRSGTAVAVAGPTQSGKTRLVNRLTAAGVLAEVSDDDCPVLLPDGRLASLVPRRYEVALTRTARLGALVLLADDVSEPGPGDPSQARAQLGRIPVPWPAGWLPGVPLAAVPELGEVPVVLAPSRDEACAAQVAELLSR